jgi:hypothetical protein
MTASPLTRTALHLKTQFILFSFDEIGWQSIRAATKGRLSTGVPSNIPTAGIAIRGSRSLIISDTGNQHEKIISHNTLIYLAKQQEREKYKHEEYRCPRGILSCHDNLLACISIRKLFTQVCCEAGIAHILIQLGTERGGTVI